MKQVATSLLAVVAGFLAAALPSESLAAVEWPLKELFSSPRTFDASEYSTNGNVKVTFIEGLPCKGKPTRIFAYYGVPPHKPGEKVPAMVLVHGGGGSAFYRWVKFWNSKGYAAISMDTCGSVSGNTRGSEQRGHFRHKWAGPPPWNAFAGMDDPDDEHWLYHAVVAVIRSNSFLRSLPDVDPDRIGITGVSWGGILTCMAASLDDRFRFAAPVYGCGANFTKAPAWISNARMLGEKNIPEWERRWDPIGYLPRSKVPFHWLIGTNDQWFSLPSLNESRDAVKTGGDATVKVRMVHAHGRVSEEVEELLFLANHHLKGGPAFPRIGAVKVAGRTASAEFTHDAAMAPAKAVLDYTLDEPGTNGMWASRFWKSAPAVLSKGKITATLPPSTRAFYLNLETADGLRTSSRAVELDSPVASDRVVEVRVRQTPGGPMIHVDGKPVPPRFFFGRAHGTPEAVAPFYRTLKHCRDAGVRFISFGAPNCWASPSEGPRWDWIDDVFDRVIAAHPDALIVPRVNVNAHKWLLNKNPDWKMKFEDGKDYGGVASVSAHDYRDQVARHIEKLVRHLLIAYPRNFGGIHVTGQSYGEFFYMESIGGVLHGLEPAVRNSWRKWLKAQGEKGADTAEIPSIKERRSCSDGMLRDPVADRRMVLFSRFEQEEMADFVAAMAAAARRGSDGLKLVMFFHGYGFEHTTVPNGPAVTGDYGSERMLTKAAGNIDILCAPFSYVNRRYLAPTMTQIAAESALLRGVMPLDEDDTRTYLVNRFTALELAGGWKKPVKEQTIRQLRSNLTSCIARGRASWWMDLVGHGWYDDRDLWRVMEELRPLDERMLSRKTPFTPEIALLLDERGMLYPAAGSAAAFMYLLKHTRGFLEKCGTTYGQYFATDALAGKVPSRLQIFTSSFYADGPMQKAIAAQRASDPEVTRVWCWAPGWLAPGGRDAGNIFRTTGFRARRIPGAFPEVTSTPAGKALGFPDSWTGWEKWGKRKIDPLFAVEATEGETLARWPDGSPAVAARKAGRGYEVFCAIPALPTEVIVGLAKLAGCRLYAEPGTAYVHVAEGQVFAEPIPANP